MVGNTLLNTHVTDGRVHGLQSEKTFPQATVDFSNDFLFKWLPSHDTIAFSNSFKTTELRLPLFHLLLTQSDQLAPYCFSTFLAGTHNYRAGIHNYFLTICTMTTVHHGLPLGGWYCTISFFFLSVLPKQWAPPTPPQDFDYAEPRYPHIIYTGTSKWSLLRLLFVFLLLG